MKSIKFQGDMLNFCDFIQDFVFPTIHHLNVETAALRVEELWSFYRILLSSPIRKFEEVKILHSNTSTFIIELVVLFSYRVLSSQK